MKRSFARIWISMRHLRHRRYTALRAIRVVISASDSSEELCSKVGFALVAVWECVGRGVCKATIPTIDHIDS